ncbi:MAG: NADH-quinone oxidoreductase subunit NuoK [Proteobacteria bacterium]|nr:MAG: NADH-quinone oxidoreductase subunit NuoK [Pseudomonadota bacterium]
MNTYADPMIFPALLTAAAMFSIGLAGVMMRRSLIAMLMCIELMLNAVNLTLVTFSRANHDLHGQLMVFFVVVVAAAEAAIGLGLLIALFRNLKEVGTSNLNLMKE